MKVDSGTAAHGGLIKSILKRPTAFGYFEADLKHQFLPKCTHCGAPHPMAMNPPIHSDRCQRCSTQLPPVEDIHTPAVITDRKIIFGNAMMKIGAWLNRIAMRIPPCA